MLGHTALLLIADLKKQAIIDDRFEQLELKNVDPVTQKKTGCFSLVFKAFDRIGQRWVALKFYDPGLMNQQYRLNGFHREHEILKALLSQSRCLQLASDLKMYQLKIPVNGVEIELACPYFAVEWLDGDIEGYFLSQERYEAAAKLRLFNHVVLAAEALHARGVFHRDLKADNLRAYDPSDKDKRIIVAIDLGTAARLDSGHAQPDYDGGQVGAKWYASPEARCGLAGNRKIARYTDVYAVGCLLFELFNADYFFKGLSLQNPSLGMTLSALSLAVHGIVDADEQIRVWSKSIDKFGPSVAPVSIDGDGSTVPSGVASILNEVLHTLTHVDFRVRARALSLTRERIWQAIRILENEKLYRHKAAQARILRQRRVEKALARDARFAQKIDGVPKC